MNYQEEKRGIISTQVCGILDYLIALLLIASPKLFGFYNVDNAAALITPYFFGGLLLVMSIFTKYEMSPIKVFPLQLNLILTGFVGFVLTVWPFLYGFYNLVFLPHLLIGLSLMFIAYSTKHSPFTNKMEVLDSRGL